MYSMAIFTAVIAVVFLCIGYGFGYSTKTGQNALKQAMDTIKDAIPKAPDDAPDRGFYDR